MNEELEKHVNRNRFLLVDHAHDSVLLVCTDARWPVDIFFNNKIII